MPDVSTRKSLVEIHGILQKTRNEAFQPVRLCHRSCNLIITRTHPPEMLRLTWMSQRCQIFRPEPNSNHTRKLCLDHALSSPFYLMTSSYGIFNKWQVWSMNLKPNVQVEAKKSELRELVGDHYRS